MTTMERFKQDEYDCMSYKYDECWYESPEDVIQTGMLGFCACGDPESNLRYIKGGLQLIEEYAQPRTHEQHLIYQNRLRQYHGSHIACRFFYYWCDKEELVDHGVGLPGWLSEKGKQLLIDLQEVCQ